MKAELLPMLCGRSAQVVPTLAPDRMAEPKMDGWRCIVQRERDTVRLYGGRNGSDYTGRVPYIEDELSLLLPPDTVIDGEIVSPQDWGAVQSIMTTHEVHRPSAASPALWLYVFDVLRLGGEDTRRLRWTDRRKLIEQLIPNEKKSNIRLTALVPANQETLAEVLKVGFEGLVIKEPSSSYLHGRSSYWMKVKPQQTCEARVIGFKPGEGSFAGLIGAIEFELLDSGVKSRCSGFDMNLRREISGHREEWLGKTIEIKHHGLSRDGKPRHPQFLRVRGDRVPEKKQSERRRTVATTRTDGTSGRNYKAMGDDKLVRSLKELEAMEGEAYEKCVSKGASAAADLAVASEVARERGLLGWTR